LNVNSIVSQITGNVDNIGKIVGFAYGVQKSNPAVGFTENLEWMITQAFNDPHFPNVSHIITDLTKGMSSAPLKDTVKIALLGEILSYLKLGGKWANIIKRGGWNAALGVGIFSLAAHATMWHSEGQKTPSGSGASVGNSPSWGYRP